MNRLKRVFGVGRFFIWALTCAFQQWGNLTRVASNEPVQPPFKFRNSKWCSVSSITVILAKALIRLRVCAGWSEALLVTHTTLLEISYRGPFTYGNKHFYPSLDSVNSESVACDIFSHRPKNFNSWCSFVIENIGFCRSSLIWVYTDCFNAVC